jgi:hypothetical protein
MMPEYRPDFPPGVGVLCQCHVPLWHPGCECGPALSHCRLPEGRPKAAFRSAVYKFTFKFTFKFATGSGGGHLAVGPQCRPHGVATGLTGSGSGALPARGCQGLLVLVLSCLGVAWAVGESESDAHRMTRTSRTHPTTSWHWSRLGMGLLCAQKVLAESGIIADCKRAHRAASAGLFATAGEPASHAYWVHVSRRQQQACVWKAAAGGTCVRYPSNRAISSRLQPRMASACSL